MKNTRFLIGGLLAASIALVSCSSGVKLATYKMDGKTYSVNVGEVAKQLQQYVMQQPNLVSDTESQKQFVFQQLILPELIFNYEMSQNFTNSPEFISNYGDLAKKVKLFTLYDEGYSKISNEFVNEKFEMARASHILIRVSAQTNVNGTMVTLDSNQMEKLWADKLAVAKNILDFLKQSRQIDKDFDQAVSDYSEDPGSRMNHGDIGYFTRGRMVPEFEEAVFGFHKKGLIGEIIKTQFGYHIIYVTDPVSKKTVSQIQEAISDPQTSYYTAQSLEQTYFYQIEASNKTLLYTIVSPDGTNKGGVMINNVLYQPNEIPNETALVKLFGMDYTWGDCKDLIGMFVPDFETDLSLQNFYSQMSQFNNLMIFVSYAKKNHLDSGPAFNKKYEASYLDTLKNISRMELSLSWKKVCDVQATPEALMGYYTNMVKMGTAVTNIRNADGTFTSRPLSYLEMTNQVRSEFLQNQMYAQFDAWRTAAMTNYSVAYNEAGFKTLQEVLQKELDKFLKSPEGQQMQQQMMQQQLMQMMQQQGGQIQQ